MADLAIQETGNGGDIILTGDRVELTEGLFTMIYIALFGGNPEQSTSEVGETGQRFDWWGNALFFPDDPDLQINSRTERVLSEVALDSSGRAEIEAAAKEDLRFMSSFADVSVVVAVEDVDRARITVTVDEPGGLEEQNFIFLWDGTKVESITNKVI